VLRENKTIQKSPVRKEYIMISLSDEDLTRICMVGYESVGIAG
jgi:hypothetical protein